MGQGDWYFDFSFKILLMHYDIEMVYFWRRVFENKLQPNSINC